MESEATMFVHGKIRNLKADISHAVQFGSLGFDTFSIVFP
jgi:hypothetical protein